MALRSPKLDEGQQQSASQQQLAGLEPELHEGDGRAPTWIWLVVGAVILCAAVFAPFQLYWPFG